MESGYVVKAIYAFKSGEAEELELQIGDVIQVIQRVDRHWLNGVNNGRVGNFPSGFVMEIKIPPLEAEQALFAALTCFIAQESGDLSFDKGDVIVGIEKIDANWWHGKINNDTGIFPLTHVWALDTTLIKKSAYPKSVSMVARVKMDMNAQLAEEIDLKQGQHVLITEIVDKDWYRGSCNGKTGLIPAAFVTIVDEGESASIKDVSSTSVPLELPMPVIDVITPSPPVQESDTNSWIQACNESNDSHYGYDSLNSGITPYGRTLSDFRGEFPNELSFKAGELVQLMRHVDDYWLEGEIDGKIGLFPQKCIDVIVDCPEAVSQSVSHNPDTLQQVILPNDTFGRVLFEFSSTVEGDLNLKEGDTITLLRKLNDNWYEGLTDNGKIGLCPANYVEIIGDTRKRTDSIGSRVSDWKFNSQTSNSFDLSPKLDSSNSDNSASSFSRSFSVHEPPFSYNNHFETPKEDTAYRPKLTTQSSLPALSSNDLFGSLPELRSEANKPLHPRRSAPVAPFRFPDIIEDASNATESTTCTNIFNQDSRNPTVLTRTETEKLISDKTQQKQKFERCRDKLKYAVRDETEARSPGGLEFNRQIKEYDAQILSLQSEIEDLKGQMNISNNSVSSSQIDIDPERNKRDAQVEKNRKEEDLRKGVEKKRKDMDQRQCIITELLQTERDYLQDLQICHSIFLRTPEDGRALGIDMITLFGNLDEVIDIANRLLKHLSKCCFDKPEDQQVVGECFVNLGEDLKEVYGHYCRNHDEVNPLLKRYESNAAVQNYISRGVERMKAKTNCFDLQSVLIKPVQRILKYPLLLNELLKCTEESHVDKANLLKAVDLMAEVAMAINEFKRRKDLVFKYRKDTDTSLSSRFSKLTLHSLRKKSSRISTMLSSSLGLSSVTKDEDFAEAEKKFQTVEKTLKIFLKDLTAFLSQMQEFYSVVLNVAEDIGSFYQERKGLKEVNQLRSVHRIIFTQFWEDFRSSIDKRVLNVIKQLLQMFHGPHNLIQKRHDKLLDYDAYESRLKGTKDANKIKALQEEVQLAKNTYEALNAQLLDELPQLCSMSIEVLHDCIMHFMHSRRTFIGRSAKEMLNLMQLPSLSGSQGDILEVFKVKHNLVVDALVQLSLVPMHLFPSAVKLDGKKTSPATSSRRSLGGPLSLQVTQKPAPQSPGQQAHVRSQYRAQSLFAVTEDYTASDLLDLSLNKGDIVGVIKKKDPMDNPNRWFVDNGAGKGFVPAQILSSPTPAAPPRLSYPSSQGSIRSGTPSPDVTRYCNLPSNRNSLSAKSDTLDLSDRSATNWNLLNVSVDSKSSGRSGQSSPRYSELDEFDPLTVSPSIHSYEELASPDHRYEVIPDEDQSPAGSQSYQNADTSPGSCYENVPDQPNQETDYCYAKYSFSANGANQLSLVQGQVVLLVHGCDLHGNSEWYFVEDRYGNQGYVPANYLNKYYKPL